MCFNEGLDDWARHLPLTAVSRVKHTLKPLVAEESEAGRSHPYISAVPQF